MITVAIMILVVAIILMLIGAFKKSGSLNKVVSLNCVTSYVIVLISLLALTDENKVYFFDVAIIYGILGFISSVAFLKYLHYRR